MILFICLIVSEEMANQLSRSRTTPTYLGGDGHSYLEEITTQATHQSRRIVLMCQSINVSIYLTVGRTPPII